LSESEDKGSNPGDRETSQNSQRENNTTIPARNIAESTADLQDVPSKGEGAITVHCNKDESKATTWPANNVNQLPETSPTCNPQPTSVEINCSPRSSGISSTPYSFEESTFSNSNMESRKIPYPPSSSTCFDSLALRGIGCYDLDQYLMKNPVKNSNDMIMSTLRLSSGLQAAPFVGQFDSNQAFISGNAFLNNEKHQMSLQASDVPTSYAVPDEVTGMSYPYHISPSSVAAALGDFNPDIFHALLESVVYEELQLRQPGAHTSVEQNVERCPLSQSKASDLTDDLWSMLFASSV
jgi:hypothetical protein